MVDPQELMNDLSAEAKAKQAVADLQSTLRDTASDKSREAEATRQEGSLADTAEEKQAFNEQASFLDKEAVAYKEEAYNIEENKEQYIENYNKTEQSLEAETYIEPEKEELEGSVEQEEEQAEAEADFEPTAGDEIKDVFPDEGLLVDKAFAEMLGNIADRIQEAVHTQEQQQEPER